MKFLFVLLLYLTICKSQDDSIENFKTDFGKNIYPTQVIENKINVEKLVKNLYPENVNILLIDETDNITESLNLMGEEELSRLNYEDSNIIQLVGQIASYSKPEMTVIINSIRKQRGLGFITTGKNINKMPKLICGYSPQLLWVIPRVEFAKINSEVFKHLHTCCDHQLQVLKQQIIRIFGEPKVWSSKVIKHIQMIVLTLTEDEFRSLRPSVFGVLNINDILKYRSEYLKDLTSEQYYNLNNDVKLQYPQNITYLKSDSITIHSTNEQEICILIGLFIRTYLLLKF